MEQEKVSANAMSELLESIQKQNACVEKVDHPEVALPLLKINLEGKRPFTLLVTDGLSEKRMVVPDHLGAHDRIELFWALPEYWDLSDLSHPNVNWIFHWMNKLISHLLEKEVWYGHGHTFHTGQLSPTMKQEYLMLMNPIMSSDFFTSIEINNTTIGFLSMVPIFKTEFEYKQQKGTNSLVNKLAEKGVSEVLDDFRTSVMKKRFGYLR